MSTRISKAVKKSISLPPEVLEAAELKAREGSNGNLSRYIQALLVRDTESAPLLPERRETIIEELAEQWTPTIADNLKQLLHDKKLNQAELFGRCLTKLRDYLASCRDCPEGFIFVPESKCPAFAEKQRRLGLMLSQSRKEIPAADAQALLKDLENHRLEKSPVASH